LKSLGFLTQDAKPTERYFRFLDQTQSAAVLAEGIREAYADLFHVNTKAQNLTQSEVINKLKTLSQGQLSEAVLEKVAMTFAALCRLADFKAPAPPPQPAEATLEEERPDAEAIRPLQSRSRLGLGGLHYNIQIILPETRDAKVYDAIFRSLREHLI
jgi:hypothetical protein